jgi:hypothetical protein
MLTFHMMFLSVILAIFLIAQIYFNHHSSDLLILQCVMQQLVMM